MAFLTTVANSILNELLRAEAITPAASLMIGLHTADPGTTGANEVSSTGGYARQVIAFDSASSKVSLNTSVINFTGMALTTVAFIGLYSTASVLWWSGTMTPNKATAAGDTLQIAAGGVTATLT